MLTKTRDVAAHLQRLETELIPRDLWPLLRDLNDHRPRNPDRVEMQRDLLTGAMDIYLSSVANRTNQVMKVLVLTVLGTIALPAIGITSFFGMNQDDLPWIHSPQWSRNGARADGSGDIGSADRIEEIRLALKGSDQVPRSSCPSCGRPPRSLQKIKTRQPKVTMLDVT